MSNSHLKKPISEMAKKGCEKSGYEDAKYGRLLSDCPHLIGSDERFFWTLGWRKGFAEFRKAKDK